MFFCFAQQEDQISSHSIRLRARLRRALFWNSAQITPISNNSLSTASFETQVIRHVARIELPSTSDAMTATRRRLVSIRIMSVLCSSGTAQSQRKEYWQGRLTQSSEPAIKWNRRMASGSCLAADPKRSGGRDGKNEIICAPRKGEGTAKAPKWAARGWRLSGLSPNGSNSL
jgi:hypothetical protein